jgi:hypothetical protein
MKIIRPQQGQTTTIILRSLDFGIFLLLNVSIDGAITSVCVNIESDTSAGWRRKEKDKGYSLNLDSPGFLVTNDTLVLSCADVNVLANNFHVIREAIPSSAVESDNVAIGNLKRDGTEMGLVLSGLERRSADILAICESLLLPLDTTLFAIRHDVGDDANLMVGGDLSAYAKQLLAAFSESQRTYATLPHLRGFGTENQSRNQDRPHKRDALLRYYMQHNRRNPLALNRPLDFVNYELKPLNISDTMKWTCRFDPRTESVDLLLALNGMPVLTEVKMAGDKFVSSAVVQLLYYASIMANENQKARLCRQIEGFTSNDCWLCIIAEKRNETKSNEAGFMGDLDSALLFLQHEETRRALAPFFGGAIVVVIREDAEPFCRTRNIPSFRVVEKGEHFIEWNQR